MPADDPRSFRPPLGRSMSHESAPLHVMVRVGDRLFGIPAACVAEMVRLPRLSQVPHSQEHVRGVMTLRGEAIEVFDLRRVVGLPTLRAETEELLEMLAAREEDHRRWLAELERSVRERVPFGLATDPHKCAFGRWYDAFETDNAMLLRYLPKFDEPHQRIHALAREVDELVRAGDADRAIARIEATRGRELAEMIALFRGLRDVLGGDRREIVLVLRHPDTGASVAYSVDIVESVHEAQALDDERASGATPEGISYALFGPKKEIAVLFHTDELFRPRARAAAPMTG